MKAAFETPYIDTERLAYWYFRLNGFLTLENFVVHPQFREQPGQKTDADIYGVRFCRRSELGMPDDEWCMNLDKTCFVLVEVTQGECKLNVPWKQQQKKNIQYVLDAIGAFDGTKDEIAAQLYGDGVFEDQNKSVRLIAVGARLSQELRHDRPKTMQLMLSDMLR